MQGSMAPSVSRIAEPQAAILEARAAPHSSEWLGRNTPRPTRPCLQFATTYVEFIIRESQRHEGERVRHRSLGMKFQLESY